MNPYARYRTRATRIRAPTTNLNGSNVGDHARIHQGDKNIFVKYWKSQASSRGNKPSSAVQGQLDEKEKIECRSSLSFRDIGARLQNISPTHPGTCDWFFETSVFQKWYDHIEHNNRLLWIKGNPGTGKSTLMKHILEYCQNENDYAIVSYFFNARGAELEKTPLGMLRSLLFQLLEHEPSLYDQFLLIFRKKNQDSPPGGWEWGEPELIRFFLSEVPKCQSRPLLLIIDALDECSDGDVKKVAEFLQYLSTDATNAGTTLKICLSSRHYPFIRFRRYQELVLEKEEQHDEDINNYISSNLIKRDEAIEKALRNKSSGIFMWVVLVITMLNKAYDEGKMEAMKQKLTETPAELEEVFEMLLNRNNPDKDETILILQWVLFAKRLLTPEEIYFGLIAGTNRQALGKWDPLQITPDIIRRRIISTSRGLIEIRKDRKETVQFIHESVNDFLVRNGRLQKLDPGLMQDPIAKSQDRLKNCCMSYLMMESLELSNNGEIESFFSSLEFVSRFSSIESASGVSSFDSPSKVSSLEFAPRGYSLEYTSGFPFLNYASTYVFDHAEEATLVSQTELLRSLKDDSVLKRLERLHSYFVNYGRDFAPLSLLHILAARGLSTLVETLLDHGIDINANGRPHGTALNAAIYYGREKTVKTLLTRGAHTRGSLTRWTPLKMAFHKPNREILAMLIENGAKLGVRERLTEGNVLHQAAQTGDKDVIATVLEKGAKINARGPMGTALSDAAYRGEIEILEMFLEKGADINARGIRGTALMAAAESGHKEIVKMLLEKGAKIHTRSPMGTALMAAAESGHKEIVEMLLRKGAKINARSLMGTALVAAASGGEIEIVEMLLEKGAKINARGIWGTALAAAADNGRIKIAEMLLEKGAKINARGFRGSPLQRAAFRGNKEMVEMLLNKGAKINVWGGLYGNALHAAAYKGEMDIANLLLEKGANINARGLKGNPLQGAAIRGKKEMVEMLLDKGAKVNARGGFYGNALQGAVAVGDREIVRMLLDKGANINARLIGPTVRNYPIPPTIAGMMILARQPSIDAQEREFIREVLRMLSETRFKVNTWGNIYGTALQKAVYLEQWEIVKILLDKGAKA